MPGMPGGGNSGSLPLNAQTRPQASAVGKVKIRAPGGILSPVGMRVHIPEWSKRQ
jgi:hypothetical protein